MFNIVINTSGETVRHMGLERLKQLIENAPFPVNEVHYAEGDEVGRLITEMAGRQEDLMVGGGDGTVLYAASITKDLSKPFAILPLGTMNLMAQDIGLPRKLKKVMRDYRHCKTINVDIGYVNEKPFLCAVGLRLMPQMSKIRERNRALTRFLLFPKMGFHIFRRLDASKHFKLIIDGQPQTVKSSMLVITNNLINHRIDSENSFKKSELQGGRLGIYGTNPKGFWDKLKMLVHMGNGYWKRNPSVIKFHGREVEIMTGNNIEDITLDGELMQLETPLKFRIEERALALLVPKRKHHKHNGNSEE